MMTSNRPLEDWGKPVGDVPAATAILDRFVHHADVLTITGKSYRLRREGQGTRPKNRGADRRSFHGTIDMKYRADIMTGRFLTN